MVREVELLFLTRMVSLRNVYRLCGTEQRGQNHDRLGGHNTVIGHNLTLHPLRHDRRNRNRVLATVMTIYSDSEWGGLLYIDLQFIYGVDLLQSIKNAKFIPRIPRTVAGEHSNWPEYFGSLWQDLKGLG